jgi:hypothetical protein
MLPPASAGLSDLRTVGLVFGMALLLAAIWLRSRRKITVVETLMYLATGAGLSTVSLWPSAVNGLATVISTGTRLLTLAILSNMVLFGLFLLAMRQTARTRETVSELVRALARAEYERTHPDREHQGVLVVIPAYDEEQSLQELLPRIPNEIDGSQVRVVVIVDGGKDGSAAVARRLSAPVSVHPINQGQGDAIRTGFDLAMRQGAEIVVTMDADGQHRPEELARLVLPIQRDEADLVLGSRFSGEYADRGGGRHLGIVVFSFLMRMLTRVRISDCTNGYRAIRVSSLRQLVLREPRFSAPEILMQAAACRLRIVEVPVTICARNAGASKKPASWRYPRGFAAVILRAWLRT